LEKKLGKELDRDAAGLRVYLRMLQAYGTYLFRQPRQPKGDILLQIDAKLTDLFLAVKFELASATENFNRLFQTQLSLPGMESGLSMAKSHLGQEGGSPAVPLVVQMHYLGYLLMANPNQQNFQNLRAFMLDEEARIQPDDLQSLYHLSLNYCAFGLQEGLPVEEETDEIYNELLKAGWLGVGKKIHPEHFKNIISLRLKRNHLDAASEFFETHRSQLTHDHEGVAITYNQSLLDFFSGNYESCIKGMEQVLTDFKQDIYYTVDARTYLLKAIYLLGEDDTYLDSQLNSFRVYIHREKKIALPDREFLKLWVKSMRTLVDLRGMLPEKRVAKATRYRSQLSELKRTFNRNWFESQLDILLQSH